MADCIACRCADAGLIRATNKRTRKMKTVDLNSDLGESFGAWEMGNDAAMIDVATSVNVACGFHGGDYDTMRKTVELASTTKTRLGSTALMALAIARAVVSSSQATFDNAPCALTWVTL